MSIDASEVARIAHLARLHVSEADAPRYARELSGILELVEQMQARDTAQVEPMAHPLDASQRLRPDEVTEPDRRDAAGADSLEIIAHCDAAGVDALRAIAGGLRLQTRRLASDA